MSKLTEKKTFVLFSFLSQKKRRWHKIMEESFPASYRFQNFSVDLLSSSNLSWSSDYPRIATTLLGPNAKLVKCYRTYLWTDKLGVQTWVNKIRHLIANNMPPPQLIVKINSRYQSGMRHK